MATTLMSLPDEIKLLILMNLDIDAENTHQMLRQTHPWFRANISTAWLREQLWVAEGDQWRYLHSQLRRQLARNGLLICYTTKSSIHRQTSQAWKSPWWYSCFRQVLRGL